MSKIIINCFSGVWTWSIPTGQFPLWNSRYIKLTYYKFTRIVRQKDLSYYENGLENDHVSITTHLDARTQQNGTTIKNKMVVRAVFERSNEDAS